MSLTLALDHCIIVAATNTDDSHHDAVAGFLAAARECRPIAPIVERRSVPLPRPPAPPLPSTPSLGAPDTLPTALAAPRQSACSPWSTRS